MMSDAKSGLNRDLMSILRNSELRSFTVLGIRDAYLESFPEQDKKEIRAWIYRQIQKMTKRGLLEKVKTDAGGKACYVKTERFYSVNPILPTYGVVNEKGICSKQDLLAELKGKLQRYKVEMLTCLGESDEYKTLSVEFPQLKDLLLERYDIAVDKSSKLLGRVKALEVLIEQQRVAMQ